MSESGIDMGNSTASDSIEGAKFRRVVEYNGLGADQQRPKLMLSYDVALLAPRPSYLEKFGCVTVMRRFSGRRTPSWTGGCKIQV
jgi:hypothetical protein